MLKYAFIPLLPFFGFLIAGLFGKFLKEKAAYVAVAGVSGAFLLSYSAFRDVLGGSTINGNLYSWISIGTFSVNVGLQIDELTVVMLLVVTALSSLIHIYSLGFMQGDTGYARFFAYLSLFTFFMLVLVMANNFLLLFVGWEGTALCSYLLIGFWYEKKSAAAGIKAFIINRIGGVGFVLALLLIFITFGTLDFAEVFRAAAAQSVSQSAASGVTTLIALLLFLAAIAQSAQIPLFVWLPDAQEGPTPAIALMHTATTVAAGVFLVARCAPLFSLSSIAMTVVAVVGCLTAVLAATVCLVQNDIKRLIAYSTISQAGYMFLGLGIGAFSAGMFHLTTHAFFKGLLFLAAGSVVYALSDEQDLRKMGALKSRLKITHGVFLISCLALAGIFPFAGFFSMGDILWSAYSDSLSGRMLWALAVMGAFMTAFYSFRLAYLVFYGKSRVENEVEQQVQESPMLMTIPLIIMAFFALAAGLIGYPGYIIPEFFGGFLAPLFPLERQMPEASHWLVLGLMAFSVIIAAAGWRLAYAWYLKNPSQPDYWADRFKGAYGLLLERYKIDEFYNRIFVDGLAHTFSHVLYRVGDVKIVNGAMNGIARFIEATSASAKKLQTGSLQQYAFTMSAGFIVLVGLYFTLK